MRLSVAAGLAVAAAAAAAATAAVTGAVGAPAGALTAAAAPAYGLPVGTSDGGAGPPAVARQVRSPAGEPCTDDDDCGGYAVSPPLWCRPGYGTDGATCRAYVGLGQLCNSTGLGCPGYEAGRDPPVAETVTCRGGRCQRKVPPVTLGALCVAEVGCAAPLDCVYPRDGGGGRSCAAAYQGLGEPCGTSPYQTCQQRFKCATPAGACTNTTCPGSSGPPTCQEVVAGDRCGPGTTLRWSCPGSLTCKDGTCVPYAWNDVGGACSTPHDACADDLTCEAPGGVMCKYNQCPGWVAGTCRMPRLGEPCTSSERCSAGGSGLWCEDVDVGQRVCMRHKAAGEPCGLVGIDNVCGGRLLCVGGACQATSEGAVAGDECGAGARRTDKCPDGSSCVDNAGVTAVARWVCADINRRAGASCSPDGTRGTEYCETDLLLTCVGGVCVAPAPEDLPGEGQPCDPTFQGPCGGTVDATGLPLECLSVRITGASSRYECRYQRPHGGPCGDVGDCENRSGTDCVAGVCGPLVGHRAVLVNGSCNGDNRPCGDGLVCHRPSSRSPWLSKVCLVGAPVGAACTGDLEPCADGRCLAGRCEPMVAPGGACAADGDCAPGHACWRGAGAAGRTCRRWVGPAEACDNAAAKCWRELACGADGRCAARTAADVAAEVCDDDADCAGEGWVCGQAPAGGARLRTCLWRAAG